MVGMVFRLLIVVSFIIVVAFLLNAWLPNQAGALVMKDYPVRWIHIGALAAFLIGVKYSSAK
jgi:hypothetical protein